MTQSAPTLYTTYINNKPFNIPSAAPPPYDSLMSLPDYDYEDPSISPANIIINANTKVHGTGNILALSPNDLAARITTTLMHLLRQTGDEDDDPTRMASGINITLNCNIDVTGDRNVIGDRLALARMQMAAQQKVAMSNQQQIGTVVAATESGVAAAMPISGGTKRAASSDDDDEHAGGTPEPKRIRVDSAALMATVEAGAASSGSE